MTHSWIQRLLQCSTLLLACSAAAQTARQPTPGQWEITTAMSGAPRGGEPVTRSACVSASMLSAGPEAAFKKAFEEGGKQRGPNCSQNITDRQTDYSAWMVSCTGPATLQGQGKANWSEAAYSSSEQLSGKSPMGELTITRTVTAKRSGDCAAK
jgi:hypothetical protein